MSEFKYIIKVLWKQFVGFLNISGIIHKTSFNIPNDIIGLYATLVFLQTSLHIGQWEPIVDLILLYTAFNSISESSKGNTL